MSSLRMCAAVAAAALALTAGAGGLAQAAPRPADVPLPGSAVPFTSHIPATGNVAGARRLTVGGTTLGIGAGGHRLFESGWSNWFSALTRRHTWGSLAGELAASGGGPSLVWPEPAYQRGVVPARLTRAPGTRGGPARSVPDISADGDAATGFALGTLTFPTGGGAPVYGESEIGGTGQVTLPGYDNMTGLGSPNGPRFSQLLRELARS